MKLRITPHISTEIPQLLLGIVIAKNANNNFIHSAVQQLIRGAFATKQKELEKTPIAKRASIELWKKYVPEPHISAILEEVAHHPYFSFGNTLEDLALYFAVRYEVPITVSDLDEVSGDIELCKAINSETFRPRGSIRVEHPDVNEIIYKDRAGVIGRHFGSELSQRTALTNTTKNAIFIIEGIGDLPLEKMKGMLKEMEKAVKSYTSATIELAIIGENITEIDLGVAGRLGVNDADFKPDPRRLAFHQKLVENFERMKKTKSGLSMSVKGHATETPEITPETAPEELSAAPAVEEITPEKPPEELAAAEIAPELPAAPEEKELTTPAEPAELEPPKQSKRISAGKPPAKTPVPAKPTAASVFIEDDIKNALAQAIKTAYPRLATTEPTTDNDWIVEQTNDPAHGDYASNIALITAKKLKLAPQEVARVIVRHATAALENVVEKLEIAGPGFINVRLKTTYVDEMLKKITKNAPPFTKCNVGAKRTILLDYSSPNIAKPLGVHHLLSTIIGQTLCNCFTFLGYKTTSINHIGDWGTQFGKLTVAYQKWGDKKTIERDPIEELLKLYVKFHDEAEKEHTAEQKTSALEDEARAVFKKLEDGDKETCKLWQWFVAISLKDAQKTYDALGGINFDKVQGESFYNDKMDEILAEGREKNIFTIGEEGAIIVAFDNDKYPPALIQKSDGTTLYATRDLAAFKYRVTKWHPERILYVVDVAQSLHFQQIFDITHQFGWDTDTTPVHVSFGRMRFVDEQMSTRKGNIVRLNEVLREAVERAKSVIVQKATDIPEKQIPQLARVIGIGAIKYNILSQNRTTDIVFDWDKMLSLDGNSAPYIQYTHARASSILEKAAKMRFSSLKTIANQFTLFDVIGHPATDGARARDNRHPHEEQLARLLIRFPEVVNRAANEYRPNILCTYLYELAKLFNTFYHELPVIQADTDTARTHRLALTKAVKTIIATGLNLLGIEAPEAM